MLKRTSSIALCAALLVAAGSASHGANGNQIYAAGVQAPFPTHFAFGLDAADNSTGLTGWMPQSGIPWDYAYTYLTGGVNTVDAWWNGWADDGTFPIHYGESALAHGYTPVFIYYNLGASNGTCNTCATNQRVIVNLNNAGLMSSYFENFALLMQRLGSGTYNGVSGLGETAIVDVEPDLSGMVEQAEVTGNCFGFCIAQADGPQNLTAAVASSGDPDVAGYPDTFQGFNWALLHLRDLYAPNVLLAVHVSDWATNIDIGSNADPGVDATALGQEAGNFAAQSGAVTTPSGTSTYDLVFNDPADHDAGWQSTVNNNPGVWWDRTNATLPNFHQWEAYLSGIHQATGKAVLAWQVPIGNQYFDTENNTPYHYQDNRVEYIFSHVAELAQSGLVGVLFGQDGVNTHYYDANRDGVTNPPAFCTSLGFSEGQICNMHVSSVVDDDGGYLRMVAARYYASGGYPLGGEVTQPQPTSTPVPPTTTSTPIPPTMTATDTPVPPSATPTGMTDVIVVTRGLHLSSPAVRWGSRLTGTVTLQNQGDSAINLNQVVIAGRPPTGTNAGGPFDDFGSSGPLILVPGQSLTLVKTRAFTNSDPVGNWYSYMTYQTTDGVWHDDPRIVIFPVGATI
jgi:hypothetical protein